MPIVTGPSEAMQGVQIPDYVGNYERLMQLKNMAENAPLQRQELEQRVQAGQINLQEAQQSQRDRQAFSATMADPSMQGKTLGEIADAMAKSGHLSPQSYQALKKADVDQRQSYATLDKDQLANAKSAHDMTQQIFDNVMNMPDEQLAQSWPQIAQQYDAIPGNQKIPLNPQQPMTKAQLKNFAPFISMNNTYLDEEMKRRQTAAETGTKEAESQQKQLGTYAQQLAASGDQNTYAQRLGELPMKYARLFPQQFDKDAVLQVGMTPSEQANQPVEKVELKDWLAKNPGKGPSDYVAWKAKQAPLAQLSIMNATGNGQPAEDVAKKFGMSPVAFDQTAEKYWTSGVLPPVGRGGAAMAFNRAIMNRAAELHPVGSLAANSAEYKANEASLKNLQKFSDSVNAFEQTAEKNMNLLQETAKAIPDLGAKFANVPVRMISSSMIGTENMARFHTALNVAQTEAAKVLNNPNSSAVLSDSARKDLQQIIDGNLPYKSLVASLDTLRTDMKNRKESNDEVIKNIQTRLGGSSTGSTPQAQKPIVQHSPSTGQYRYSTDGGKTWQAGQPPQQ